MMRFLKVIMKWRKNQKKSTSKTELLIAKKLATLEPVLLWGNERYTYSLLGTEYL